MPRVVPSQIDHYLATHFTPPGPANAAELENKPGIIAGFVALYRAMPPELVNLSPDETAKLVGEMAEIELAMDRYRGGMLYDQLKPIVRSLPIVWELIKKLPDSFPTTLSPLAFITDPDIQKMVGLDIDAVTLDLQSGEWKGATILAGSACEALLLYGLQERERSSAGAVSAAVNSIWPTGKSKPNASDMTDRSWDLARYTEVAHKLGLISDNTKTELGPARDFRNLIHPAKSVRQKQVCDRGTAYVATGALDHVISDLKKNL